MRVPRSLMTGAASYHAGVSTDGDLARRIAVQCYGAEPRVEPLSRLNNLVFRLHFPGAVKVLKVALGAGATTIAKELMLIRLLARHGVPVPVVEHDDARGERAGRAFFVMASAGERSVADWVPAGGEAARALFTEMGGVLARIHGVTFPASGDITPAGIVERDSRRLLAGVYAIAEAAVGDGLLDREEAAVFRSLAMPVPEGTSLCHADFHAVQCVVREERIAAVVDWESAWAGNPAIDFAITQAYLEFYCPPALVECFAAGYTQARALPDDYADAYRPVRMAQALGLLRVWRQQGRTQNVRRAVELFRAYVRREERRRGRATT